MFKNKSIKMYCGNVSSQSVKGSIITGCIVE